MTDQAVFAEAIVIGQQFKPEYSAGLIGMSKEVARIAATLDALATKEAEQTRVRDRHMHMMRASLNNAARYVEGDNLHFSLTARDKAIAEIQPLSDVLEQLAETRRAIQIHERMLVQALRSQDEAVGSALSRLWRAVRSWITTSALR